MKKIIFILLSLIAINVQGQYQEAAPNTHTVSGKIMDGDSNTPMEYCTVSLYNSNENSLVSGNVTNMKGEFLISGDIPAGEYYIEVNFIGFSPVKSAIFALNKANLTKDMGTIVLTADAELVNEIEVTAIRSSVKYELDKKVINVDKQIAASNGNAVDVLTSVPSVQVDIDGNVKLRGNSGFQVLINGRPSILSGSDALQQIPASQIKNIEIITNPSAKYDAEGTAGIINIILKDENKGGFSGVVNARAGLWQNYGGDITMNYDTKKWTYTLAGDFSNRNMPSNMVEKRNTFNDTTNFFVHSDGEKAWRFQNYGIKGGVEFRPNEKNTIIVQGQWRNWYMYVDDDLDIISTDKIIDSTEFYKNINDTKRGGPSYRATIDYTVAMDNNSNLAFHGAFNRNFFDEEVLNFRLDNDIHTGGTQSTENGGGYRARFNIDYDITIGESAKFELGAVQQIRYNSEDIKSYTYDAATDSYINQAEFNRTVDTKRHMRAFYGTHSNQWNKISYQIGVRAENTFREIEIEAYDTKIDVKRLDLFPSAHVSYNINESNQLMASYAKRITRPRPWYLQPTQIFINPNTIFEGTPDI
ncbi:MAG: outer membrane beta-barrel protein, partial [Chitinophagales bacterium]